MTLGLYRNRSHGKIPQRDTSVSGSGSDRAVRRKPVVRSEQDVWGYGFSTASIIGDAGEYGTDRAAKSWRMHIGPAPKPWGRRPIAVQDGLF